MKNLPILLAAALAIVMAVPTARAYDKDPWYPAKKTLGQLFVRMDGVKAKQARFGAGPHLRDEIAHLRWGIADLNARVQNHAGDPKVARAQANNLSDQMSQVEAEYRDIARVQGIVIKVYPGS